jgi:type I restriction-modification system DNA methylase subunit
MDTNLKLDANREHLMNNLFSKPESSYDAIYRSLSEVREAFHREGRIGDSNAKLDETIKFLAIHFAFAKNLIIHSEHKKIFNRGSFSVGELNRLFVQVASSAPFANAQIGSIFGARPVLAFEPGDEAVAFELFSAAGHAFDAHHSGTDNLDALNEAFGHHVRDNFRSHIEDAQYMTPPEVVEFMVGIASAELLESRKPSGNQFLMADPSCGVGTFMTVWRKAYDRARQKDDCLPPLLAIGQDKVERMARLSAVNLIFASNSTDVVSVGNSLSDGSPLDEFNGQVDLILTNPPFGAKFTTSEVRQRGRRATPIFAQSTNPKGNNIDSELLFIDRYLSLLRPGGLCLAVVPDGVISAKGQASYLRQEILRHAALRGVVELPPVTFAQAGTRTKTAVLIFEKAQKRSAKKTSVFFGEADDIGFEVSKRKGVPVKQQQGANQLPDILSAYTERKTLTTDHTKRPITALWQEIDPSSFPAWTPRQFKLESDDLRDGASENGSLRPLSDFVEHREKRKSVAYSKGKFFISVLHVIGEGVLDVAGIKSYEPITPGTPINPGEIIISRLNPRIPRVLVVPNLGRPLICSTEFEVLRPRKNVPAYALSYLLLHPIVQEQIHTLTAGTSASHSRVKPERIREIRLPWPDNEAQEAFDTMIKEYESSMRALLASLLAIHGLRAQDAIKRLDVAA